MLSFMWKKRDIISTLEEPDAFFECMPVSSFFEDLLDTVGSTSSGAYMLELKQA